MSKRGRIVLRTTGAVLLLGALGLLLLARPGSEPAAAAPAPIAALRTPVLSARRVPAVFATQAADAQLQRDLTAAVAGHDACVAVDTAEGPAARVRATTPLAPASNLKLLTAAAALDTLGPGARFATRVFRAGDAIVVDGGGDPTWVTQPAPGRPFTPIDALAAKIAATGVRLSAIEVSDSRYESTRFPADWKANYPTEGEAGSIGALTVDAGYQSPGTAAADPAMLFGQKLQAALAARGVNVGAVRRGTVRAGAPELTRVDSAPLDAIIEDMLRNSDNYTAEMLAREVGFARAKHGSTAAGDVAIIDTLKQLGVPTAGLSLHDGSGLAPTDRATCDALLAAVELGTQAKFAALNTGLPVAGATGTLAARYRGTALQGKLRAKTGFIDGVTAFSGTVDDAAHPHFSFIANGNFTEAQGHGLQDAVAGVVAGYPSPIDLKNLVPAP